MPRSESRPATCGRWFAPMDSRTWVLRRFEVPSELNPTQCLEHVCGVLVSDSYGLTSGIQIAKDAYNARHSLGVLRLLTSDSLPRLNHSHMT